MELCSMMLYVRSCVLLTVNWLDHGKTLREQSVTEGDTLLLKRKLFFSDQNIDARDPIQLNLLYVQVSVCMCMYIVHHNHLLYVQVNTYMYIHVYNQCVYTSKYSDIVI